MANVLGPDPLNEYYLRMSCMCQREIIRFKHGASEPHMKMYGKTVDTISLEEQQRYQELQHRDILTEIFSCERRDFPGNVRPQLRDQIPFSRPKANEGRRIVDTGVGCLTSVCISAYL